MNLPVPPSPTASCVPGPLPKYEPVIPLCVGEEIEVFPLTVPLLPPACAVTVTTIVVMVPLKLKVAVALAVPLLAALPGVPPPVYVGAVIRPAAHEGVPLVGSAANWLNAM